MQGLGSRLLLRVPLDRFAWILDLIPPDVILRSQRPNNSVCPVADSDSGTIPFTLNPKRTRFVIATPNSMRGVGNLIAVAEGVAGGRHPAVVLPAGAEGSERYARRRRGLAILVVSPAEGVAGGRHPAGVGTAADYGPRLSPIERATYQGGMFAPTADVARGRHSAVVLPAGAEGSEGYAGRRRGPTILVVSPAEGVAGGRHPAGMLPAGGVAWPEKSLPQQRAPPEVVNPQVW